MELFSGNSASVVQVDKLIYLCHLMISMLRLFIVLFLVILTSCKDSKLQKYKILVGEADRIEIYYKKTNKTVTIPEQQIDNFKDILTRNVKPELQRKFINDVKVDFYKKEKRTGFLMIANGDKNACVNFKSERLNFGFRLTYGIGMTIDDLYHKSNHD